MKALLSVLVLAALALGARGTSAQTTLAMERYLPSFATEASSMGVAAFAAALVGIYLTGRSASR